MRSIQSGAREPGSEVEAIMQVEALLSKIKTQILADRMPHLMLSLYFYLYYFYSASCSTWKNLSNIDFLFVRFL